MTGAGRTVDIRRCGLARDRRVRAGQVAGSRRRAFLAILWCQAIGVVPVMLMVPRVAGAVARGPAGAAGPGGAGLATVGLLLLKILVVGLFSYGAYRWLVPWVLERITRTRSSEAFLLGVFI